jgi:hypothetical protein
METYQFNISINAPKQKVWDVLWEEATYSQWSSVFNEGNDGAPDLKEGSKLLFLDADNHDLMSKVGTRIENSQMTFKYLGEAVAGTEPTVNQETEPWEGTTESFNLNENNGVTELTVEVNATHEYKDHFHTAFPKALKMVKQLAEKS